MPCALVSWHEGYREPGVDLHGPRRIVGGLDDIAGMAEAQQSVDELVMRRRVMAAWRKPKSRAEGEEVVIPIGRRRHPAPPQGGALGVASRGLTAGGPCGKG